MTQLEEIRQFIQSPGFNLLTDEAKNELKVLEADLSDKEYDAACEELIQAFKHIHRNKTKNCYAPHKPVLLLAVIDLIDSGHIDSQTVHLDNQLKARFNIVWANIVPDACSFKCEWRNPFTYLDHEPFWHLCEDKNTAILSDIAFECMSNPKRRVILRDSLMWMIKNETIPCAPRLYSVYEDSPKMVADGMKPFVPIITSAFLSLLA